MRRRKASRGRPKKVKKGHNKLRNGVPFETKLCDDNLEEHKTSLKSDDAVECCIGLDKTGPYSYRVGSVNIELEGADEDIKPVIQENDIMLEVECGTNTASMFLSRLCQGSKGSCIEFDGAWLTPNEFQFVSGRETAKDWKRSIRHFGRSLKLLITKGILTVHPAACRCDSCRLLSSTTNEPKMVVEKRERDLREKCKGGSEGSASGSDKEDGEGGSDDSGDEGSEDADDDSQDSAENGDGDSGSEGGGEDVEGDEGKMEDNNNNAAGDKGSSSSSDGSSSSSSSSGSESDSEEEEKKEEEEDEEEEQSTQVALESRAEIPGQPESVYDEMSASAAVAAAAAVVSPVIADTPAESMEVDEMEGEVDGEVEGDVDEEDEDIADEEKEEVEEQEEGEAETEEAPVDLKAENGIAVTEQLTETQDNKVDDLKSETERLVEVNCAETDTDVPMVERTQIEDSEFSEEYSKPVYSPKDQSDLEPPQREITTQNEGIDHPVCLETKSEPSPEPVAASESPVLDTVPSEPGSATREESRDSESISEDSTAARVEPSPVRPGSSTPTLPDNPFKKTVERSNSGGGKSRLSNIIDLLRTSKEKETKKQVPTERPEGTHRPEETQRPERRALEVREIRDQSPLPVRREEVKPRKAEREERKPSAEDIKLNEKAQNAMRFPMGRLPFGFPPPDVLERASREAHEQLSKSHRQFEKNLESLIAQNMNPFIPEMSIFSLPEHRAQMEYNYLKNMERLDQMAKERMATMAEMRHQQLIREHNSFVAKLAEHQQKSLRSEAERPREHERKRDHERQREHERTRDKKTAAPQKRRDEGERKVDAKVPPAHRAMPEVRKDKPDQKSMQTPPAAHHHLPTSRPPSTGSKAPSSLPLPASTARAAHPAGPSSTQSRSSPMIAPIAPPLQMWSSCFPYVIPPPTMEMQRLTQFFPNLNGGLVSTEPGVRRQTESPILDLSTKKRKLQMDARDRDSRSKEPRLSSNSKSVHSQHLPNGLPRESLLHRPHINKDSAVKDRPMWPGFDRPALLSCTCALQRLNDMRTWSVDDVCCFLKGLEGCTLYVESFRRNNIDGTTLMMLKPDMLIQSLGMKPGAAHFLSESVSKRSRDLQSMLPCEYCRMKIQKG